MDYSGIAKHHRLSFHIAMWVLWILFGLLAVFKLPLLHLWISVGLAAVVAGFYFTIFT